MTKNYEDKDRAETLIMKSSTDWTIVRPGLLNDRAKTGKVTAIAKPSDYRTGSVSRADVGWYINECIARGLHIRETPLLLA